jgi:phosphoglycerol transferase MdoB-like AlkP superfamily enzyme
VRVKEYLRRKVAFFASVIEIAISIIVLIAIVIAGIQVVREVFSLAGDPKAHEGFTVFLGHAFNLIIGVEFIKMLAKHTPGSAIEVLLFAIARRYHVSPGQMLAANDLPDGTARLDEARRLLVPGV